MNSTAPDGSKNSKDNSRPSFKEKEVILLLAAIQIFLLYLSSHNVQPPESPKTSPKFLYIGALPVQGTKGSLSPYGPGLENELIAKFCTQHGLLPHWQYYPDWDTASQALSENRIQVLVAPGFGPFKKDKTIHAGPIYDHGVPTIIHYKLRYGLLNPTDLCRYQTLAVNNPNLIKSIKGISRLLDCQPKLRTLKTANIQKLLLRLRQNRSRFGLVDSRRFLSWEPFFPELRRSEVLPGQINYQWYWQKSIPLHNALRAFWEAAKTKKILHQLREKYFGFLPHHMDYFQLAHLQEILKTRLPSYQGAIIQTARENKLDPLLLIAVIYQESHFDPWATSETGVKGMLQLTQDTALDLGVKVRSNPLTSIRGGAKYLSRLWKLLKQPLGQSAPQGNPHNKELNWATPWDRWFVTLAAYNVGLGHARDAILLAKKMGLQELSWLDLKKIFPLLSSKHFYKHLPNGYARGYQAVDYVEKIRYYYYILNGLSVIPGFEANHLGPFFAARPIHWPN